MLKSIFSKLLLTVVSTLVIYLVMPIRSGYSEAADPVTAALMVRHFNTSTAQLEELAGGADQLVSKLLELRHNETLPVAPVRAQKLLLAYADRDDVRAALESDLDSDNYAGLARVVTLNLDAVQSTEVRGALARRAIARGTRDQSFAPYARSLKESKSENVRRLAKEAFGN